MSSRLLRSGAPVPFARGPAGAVLAKPWLDRLALPLVADWTLPTLRLSEWALQSGGDAARLAALTGREIRPTRALQRRLDALLDASRGEAEARATWRRALFGEAGNEHHATLAERERLDAAANMLRARFGLWSWARRWRAPRIALAPVAPDALDPRIRARAADRENAFPCDVDPIRVSRWIPSALGREYWIESASGARARVVEGEQVRGSVLVLHGLGVEPDEFLIGRAELRALVRHGFRVLLLEGPYHGRRRVAGFYAGEPVLADAPRGAIAYFERHVAEIGNVTRWARAKGDGPVGWIGTSLGAFTAAIAADAARGWAAASRPDGVQLVTVGTALFAPAVLDGALGRKLDLMPALERAGWTRAQIATLAPLTGPAGPPSCGGAHVHLLLGHVDEVTPLASGRELAERWQVPAGNIELRRQGHYTIPIGLERDPGPILRFADALER
ncbi:MAG: abhydrolase 18 [Rhodospirillales bacterium]|nr:abhydrolase 18 [Rhodospirillales bacterium]